MGLSKREENKADLSVFEELSSAPAALFKLSLNVLRVSRVMLKCSNLSERDSLASGKTSCKIGLAGSSVKNQRKGEKEMKLMKLRAIAM